jgi:hypothetical protein
MSTEARTGSGRALGVGRKVCVCVEGGGQAVEVDQYVGGSFERGPESGEVWEVLAKKHTLILLSVLNNFYFHAMKYLFF